MHLLEGALNLMGRYICLTNQVYIPYDGLIYECGLIPIELRIKEKRLMNLNKILRIVYSGQYG